MDQQPSVLTPPKTPSSTQSEPKSTAEELVRLSCLIIHAHNERDLDFRSKDAQELLTHISPNWKGHVDTSGPRSQSVTWDEQIAAWKRRCEEHPRVRFRINSISSDVNERSGVARVYMEMEVTGIGDVMLSALNELRYRKVDGRWMLYYTLGMRGSPGNTGAP